jgi:hypothetical protein
MTSSTWLRAARALTAVDSPAPQADDPKPITPLLEIYSGLSRVAYSPAGETPAQAVNEGYFMGQSVRVPRPTSGPSRHRRTRVVQPIPTESRRVATATFINRHGLAPHRALIAGTTKEGQSHLWQSAAETMQALKPPICTHNGCPALVAAGIPAFIAPWRPRRSPTISAAGTRSLGLTRCRSREILSQTLKGTPLAREQVPGRLVLCGLGTGRGSGTALKTAGKDGPVAGLARSRLRDLPAGSGSAQ